MKLEEGKLLLCMNNRIEWAKNHALQLVCIICIISLTTGAEEASTESLRTPIGAGRTPVGWSQTSDPVGPRMCGVLTENSGSLELGPLTELDSGMTYAYTNAKMSMVAPGKVLECHRRGH